MKKIFLYEPDAGIFEVIFLALLDKGYQTLRLPDPGHSGFKRMLLRDRPEVVIADHFLDVSNSTKLCSSIKTVLPEVAIIATSCNHDIEETYHQLGFDDYIRKPFDLRILFKTVSSNIKQKV